MIYLINLTKNYQLLFALWSKTYLIQFETVLCILAVSCDKLKGGQREIT